MRKIAILTSLLILFSIGIYAGGFGFINLNANFMMSADNNFSEVYSSMVFSPELKIGVHLFKGVYVWGGFVYINVSGETLTLKENASSTQYFISGGLGYSAELHQKVFLDFFAGASYIMYQEEGLNKEIEGNVFGFTGGIQIKYNFTKHAFFNAGISYVYAKDAVEGADVMFGGFLFGAGLGINF